MKVSETDTTLQNQNSNLYTNGVDIFAVAWNVGTCLLFLRVLRNVSPFGVHLLFHCQIFWHSVLSGLLAATDETKQDLVQHLQNRCAANPK